ncbi:hypothetical protein PABG_11387 [Paracoccidioides brasiliensis Pb03]|uniref:Uncharacterized protein n=1 Tax=Paracoccidioides brasiliensis (strain Pb18) TaxID=502780 RepID=A0A0A0HU16_PARBD|nr:uncharacterized protein PADG_11657 [Paracoccidioides brasiliensis Pb18]KGM92122.1 hypothetical protein PADG_11657 [Paracoccidioides brasiliensis Pb18]KGY15731.1 hypothetical protein PABG_11387 [Paracoccidioides brasiliensis Pb03]ODH47295.1 hypothetical protein GX48_06636 [Paracoccidioides brasiliensis]
MDCLGRAQKLADVMMYLGSNDADVDRTADLNPMQVMWRFLSDEQPKELKEAKSTPKETNPQPRDEIWGLISIN